MLHEVNDRLVFYVSTEGGDRLITDSEGAGDKNSPSPQSGQDGNPLELQVQQQAQHDQEQEVSIGLSSVIRRPIADEYADGYEAGDERRRRNRLSHQSHGRNVSGTTAGTSNTSPTTIGSAIHSNRESSDAAGLLTLSASSPLHAQPAMRSPTTTQWAQRPLQPPRPPILTTTNSIGGLKRTISSLTFADLTPETRTACPPDEAGRVPPAYARPRNEVGLPPVEGGVGDGEAGAESEDTELDEDAEGEGREEENAWVVLGPRREEAIQLWGLDAWR
jgi:hypothetical protein